MSIHVSGKHDRVNARRLINQRVADCAHRQAGVISYEQLLTCGVTASGIASRLRNGYLVRLYRRVYALGHRPDSTRAREFAAVLAVGGDATLGGASAIEHQGCSVTRWLPRSDRTNVCIAVSRRVRPIHGVRIVQTTKLRESDVRMVHGMRALTVERALLDLACTVDALALANMMHELAFRSAFDHRQFEEQLAWRPTIHGADVARSALAMHRAGSAGAKSELERLLHRTVMAAGLRQAQANATVVTTAGLRIQVDALWRDERLCVEVDGGGHSRARTLRDDVVRDALLTADGFTVLRVPAYDLIQRPRQVVHRITDALGELHLAR